VCDLASRALFDLVAVEHVDGFAILKEGDGRRGWRHGREQRTDVGHGSIVATGKYGDGLGRFYGMFEGHSDAGACFTSSATADGIDDYHYGAAARGNGTIYVGRSARLLDSILGKVTAHGGEKLFRVGHRVPFYFGRSHGQIGGD
jgi:hypothetical protein